MMTNFWNLDHPSENLAIISPGAGLQVTYGKFRSDVEEMMATMPPREKKALIMLLAQNRYECMVVYLASLRLGHAILLVESTLNHELLVHLIDRYRPDFIYGSSNDQQFSGYRKTAHNQLAIWEKQDKETLAIHDSLAVLLNTSGSTGSPKLVRLSFENLQANALSIASYLTLTCDEKPITSLPMAYSYGLSVINSHLLVGAALVLTEHSVLRREFWEEIDTFGCTSFAGVPYSYQLLLQTGLLKNKGASLRTLTQAGGALAPSYIRQMSDFASQRGLRFFVMYGQTEATARIAYVPFDQLQDKIGSIGIAIPGGELKTDSETSELIYTGPNVMMGYAESREDLAKGDELGGVLHTGDLARQDDDGFFYITGRMKRFLKLFGKRFNLDEVEQILNGKFKLPFACFGSDDQLSVAFEGADTNIATVTSTVCDVFALPRTAIRVLAMERLPRTSRDKTDYSALANWEHSKTNVPRLQAAASARRTTTL